jgi:hypothetical protein
MAGGHCGNVSRGIHSTHSLVRQIRDVQVATVVYGDSQVPVKSPGKCRAGLGASITGESSVAVPSDRADVACSVHLTDTMVPRVDNEQVARFVHREPVRRGELGAGSRAAISRESEAALARDGVDGIHCVLGAKHPPPETARAASQVMDDTTVLNFTIQPF